MSKFRNLLIGLAALALLAAAEVNAKENSRSAPAVVMATDGTGATAPGQSGTPDLKDRRDNPPGTYGTNGAATDAVTQDQSNLNGRAASGGEAQSHYREHWWQFWREGRPQPKVTQ